MWSALKKVRHSSSSTATAVGVSHNFGTFQIRRTLQLHSLIRQKLFRICKHINAAKAANKRLKPAVDSSPTPLVQLTCILINFEIHNSQIEVKYWLQALIQNAPTAFTITSLASLSVNVAVKMVLTINPAGNSTNNNQCMYSSRALNESRHLHGFYPQTSSKG